MPAVIQVRAPSPRKAGVAFHKDPVQSICRPTTETENTVLEHFEYHARTCHYCHKPYEAFRQGHQLCTTGHQFAQDVAAYLCNIGSDTYSTRDDYQRVRVEIPVGFDETRGLLKAIERSLRSRSRGPFVSMDRSYMVQSRTGEQPKPVSISQTHKSSRRHSREVVDWPDYHVPAVVTPASSKRGSHYEADLAQQRKDYHRYHVEVREPVDRAAAYTHYHR
ncbi:hypothetical protein EJ05DRAFT_498202 [Pseudovirgaria hyperparasitica]|uniref:Uncharacterized protein n=1 Tax=Pseudovirgaria hyperparasitica TaxID=470096 RepID=A0A6A6WEC7_9PEZI|nr:uncharacterized protein EJ05DRAFT_498202 [Pseudovirgaria hyperparasitica]KAF2760236.1 hypothetical protein EJ05DRAFT_498202 [Pseudovirgaria hyperparasitica]